MIIKDVAMRSASKEDLHRAASYLERGQDRSADPHVRVKCSFTHNLVSEQPDDTAMLEMQTAAALNQRVKSSKYLHLIISLHPNERLDQEHWQHLTADLLNSLDLKNHQALIYVHGDTDVEHAHLLINRIDPASGKANNTPFLHRRLQQAAQLLEEKYTLNKTNHVSQQTAAENKAQDLEHKSGQQSFFSYLLPLKDELLAAPTWQAVHQLLAAHDVRLEKAGRGIIFSAVTDDVKFTLKASSLDRSLSLKHLEQRLGAYEEADAQTLQIKPEKHYEQKPVGFNTEENEREQAYQRYRREQKDINATKSFLRSKLFSEYRSQLKELKDKEERFIRAAQLGCTKGKKRAAVNAFKRLVNDKKKQFKTLLNRNLNALNQEYRTQTFLDWLKSQDDARDPSAHRLLLSRDGAMMQEAVNQIYASMQIKQIRIEIKSFIFYKRTGKGMDIYHSPYCRDIIKDDGKKLITNEHPSMLTVMEMLRLGAQKFGNKEPLIITGTAEFQQQCAAAAVMLHLNISCGSRKAQEFFKHLQEDQYERAKRQPRPSPGNYAGVDFGSFRDLSEYDFDRRYGSKSDPVAGYSETQSREQREAPAAGRDLPQMPASHLDAVGQQRELLLSADENDQLEKSGSQQIRDRVRRPLYSDSAGRAVTAPQVKSADLRPKDGSAPNEVIDYINERNIKRRQISDIAEHQLFTTQSGTFKFQGVRHLGSRNYALLMQKNIIYVKEISDYALKHLSKIKKNSALAVRADGVLEAKALPQNTDRHIRIHITYTRNTGAGK